MSLLARIKTLEQPDTWPDFEKAPEERFWDGLDMATSDSYRRTGAIYLWGYTAEMLLKSAYFRFTGTNPTSDLMHGGDPVAKTRLKDVLAFGKNYHDLQGWLDLLIDTRRQSQNPNNPLNASIAGAAQFQIDLIKLHWEESLRYRYTNATDLEVHEVYQCVSWIRDNHNKLWS